MKKAVLLFCFLLKLNSYSQEVGLIANFPFNNSATSTINSEPFIGNIAYTTDRNGGVNQSLSRSAGLSSSSISNLPTGSAARTISVWFKLPPNSGERVLFEYGNGTSNSRFYVSANSFLIPGQQGLSFGAPPFMQTSSFAITTDVWYHYVVTTNSSGVVKQYINGAFLASYTGIINTAADTTCYIEGGYNGAVDDLKIYNRELTNVEVLSLYNNNTTLSSINFAQNNLEVSLYPNPVNDVLNIETALELQSVEIYNIQGQKVVTSNQKQINVSDLSAGMYMIRIQDSENNSATKKIIIE
jgi:Secretion system C-terminal sorting domain/Concanavalin A-like lectin/glucanases superfamily